MPPWKMRASRVRWPLPLVLALACSLARRANAEDTAKPLAELSLEELMKIEVTTVSRTDEHLVKTAAAIFVLTNEDIHRSGALTIPGVLQLVPGLHVSQITSSEWEVASRGFSSVNSSKLLVLRDGRSIYTPLFSGVFWDVQDVLFEDIARIEVVRGPGSAQWGANAMNGVINIISKNSSETQGVYVDGGGGNQQLGFASFRYGGHAGERFHYRVYGKAFYRNHEFLEGGGANDQWSMGRIGFRMDATPTSRDTLMFEGDGYLGNVGQNTPSLTLTGRPPPAPPLDADVAGGYVLGVYTHQFADKTDVTLRLYYDRTFRDDPTFTDNLDTADADLLGHVKLSRSQLLSGGLSYRFMHDVFEGKGIVELRPPASNDYIASGFIQDAISLWGNRLRIEVGTKLEYTTFGGFQWEPTGRIAIDPSKNTTLWASVTRAVRIPTRIERDIFGDASMPGMPPAVHVIGNRELHSEKLIATELGFRAHQADRLLVDVAGFYFHYDSLITFEPGTPFMENGMPVLPVLDENKGHGDAFGGEASISWSPLREWRLVANYSYAYLRIIPEGMDIGNIKRYEGATPRHQASLRSLLNLPYRFQLDAFIRFVDALKTNVETGLPTPSYFDADVRLAWLVWQHLELSLVGRSLLQAHHLEWAGGDEVVRSVYGRIEGRF